MEQFSAMRTFVKVVESQSFTKAAAQLGISVAMTSKLMQQLEESLSTRLLSRTTRRVTPTEAGHFYYQRCVALLAELEETHSQLTRHSQQPQGTLRLSVPMDFGYLHLSPILPEFRARYPDLNLDIDYSDRRVALVEEGFDLALRIGHLPDSSLVARPLAMMRILLCASPTYLARHGTPLTPEDLRQHDCLVYGLSQPEWVLRRGEERVLLKPKGPLRTNNGVALTRAAIDGMGIILQPSFIVGEPLRRGELVPVLSAWQPEPMPLCAIYPHRRFVSAKVRLFIDFIEQRFAAPHYWDQGAC